MADGNVKYALQMDKIAYGVAGVLGLLLLCIPMFLAGHVRDQTLLNALSEYQIAVQKSDNDLRRNPDQLGEVEPLGRIVRQQWEPGAPSELDPGWLTERAPALLRKVPKPPEVDPVHQPGTLTDVVCMRDPEKKHPYLLVKGTMSPDNVWVVIQDVKLLRKEGEGDYEPVRGFDATGDFEYADYEVKSGKAYSYRFVTVAAKDPSAPDQVTELPEDSRQQLSDEFGPTEPVPHDYSLVLRGFVPLKNPTDPPKFYAQFKYWDYAQGKVVEHAGGQMKVLTMGDKLAGDRFEISLVDTEAKTVTIKDQWRTVLEDNREEFNVKDARAPRPIECWQASATGEEVAPETTGEEGAEEATEEATEPGVATTEPEPEPEPEETTPAKKTGTGRRTFR